MSSLIIPIADMLASPVGTLEDMAFESEIERDEFEEIICTAPLTVRLRLIREEYGVQCLFEDIITTVDIPSEEMRQVPIALRGLSRELRLHRRLDDPDDIGYVHQDDTEYDVGRMIEEEILIAVT